VSKSPWWPRRILSGAAKLFTLGTVTAVSATVFGVVSARQFGIRYETVPLLSEGQAPLRILHIGDMHLVAGDRTKINFVRSLAATQPDLVVNIGDNPGGVDAIDDVLHALEPLFEFPGVFVPGSNDFFGPRNANPLRYLRAPSTTTHLDELRNAVDTRKLFDGITARGTWHRVDNRSLSLQVSDGVDIHLAGTHDAHMQADDWPGFPNAQDTNPILKIAVTHAPYRRVLDAAVADGADLVLAGHTHGGQVALPSYGAIVSNCDLPPGLASGSFPWRSAGRTGLIHVTAGIGASPTVPLRTFCPPEAVVIDLVPADQTTAY